MQSFEDERIINQRFIVNTLNVNFQEHDSLIIRGYFLLKFSAFKVTIPNNDSILISIRHLTVASTMNISIVIFI